ncbi:hypothetical protein [Pseudomonas saponiphila]|uniref:hypothetical protein n=1 Tax=Pseudomonas saponiphila TaxID=556534 RepID=UPI000B85C88E|nr:hypothetical protein [Pseudomonas saponiphila]
MNQTVRHLNVSVKIDFSHIDVEQVIKSELDLHIGQQNIEELQAKIAQALAARIQPKITIDPRGF